MIACSKCRYEIREGQTYNEFALIIKETFKKVFELCDDCNKDLKRWLNPKGVRKLKVKVSAPLQPEKGTQG